MTIIAPSSNRRWLAYGIGLLLAVLLGFVMTVHLLAPRFTSLESIGAATAKPTFLSMLLVNCIVGLSLFLYVAQYGRKTIRVLLTVIAALIIGFFIISLLTPKALEAYNALLTGPLSRLNRWGTWIEDAMSLALVGLAIAVVFRAQLFSLGGEGQIFFGAMGAGLVALYVQGLPPLLHVLLALAVGSAVGFLWALIPGALRAYLGANELVSTLMLNPIALAIYEFILVQIKPEKENFLVSAQFPDSAVLLRFIPPTRVNVAIIVVVLAVILVWLLIQRTPLGYEIRMVGFNPRFARYGGINIRRTILLSMGISGLLAGLTGSYLSLGIYQRLNNGISAGLTFEGIVVALLARNNPLAVPAMALMYAYLRVGAQFMQNDAGVSLEVVRVIQAIIILLFTAEGLTEFLRWRRQARTAREASAAA